MPFFPRAGVPGGGPARPGPRLLFLRERVGKGSRKRRAKAANKTGGAASRGRRRFAGSRSARRTTLGSRNKGLRGPRKEGPRRCRERAPDSHGAGPARDAHRRAALTGSNRRRGARVPANARAAGDHDAPAALRRPRDSLCACALPPSPAPPRLTARGAAPPHGGRRSVWYLAGARGGLEDARNGGSGGGGQGGAGAAVAGRALERLRPWASRPVPSRPSRHRTGQRLRSYPRWQGLAAATERD